MEPYSKTIGEGLRRLFVPVTRRRMGWALIDAFAHLEEREEALRGPEEDTDSQQRHLKVTDDGP